MNRPEALASLELAASPEIKKFYRCSPLSAAARLEHYAFHLLLEKSNQN
jgi:hypothetical protein